MFNRMWKGTKMNPLLRILTFAMSVLALILSLLSLALSRAGAAVKQTKPKTETKQTKPKNPNVVVLGVRPYVEERSRVGPPVWSRLEGQKTRHIYRETAKDYTSLCGTSHCGLRDKWLVMKYILSDGTILEEPQNPFLDTSTETKPENCSRCLSLDTNKWTITYPPDHPLSIKMAEMAEKVRRKEVAYQKYLKANPNPKLIYEGFPPDAPTEHRPQVAPGPAVPPAEK